MPEILKVQGISLKIILYMNYWDQFLQQLDSCLGWKNLCIEAFQAYGIVIS